VQLLRNAHRLWALLLRAERGRPLPLRALLACTVLASLWLIGTGVWHTSAVLTTAYAELFCDVGAGTAQPWLLEAQQEYNQLVQGLLSVR